MVERIDSKQKTAKYPVIVYNLSLWLAQTREFDKVEQVADEGVEFCIQYGNLIMLPLLLYNKACALAELDRNKEAKKYFAQSVVLFEIMKKDEKARQAADWCKNNYGIEL